MGFWFIMVIMRFLFSVGSGESLEYFLGDNSFGGLCLVIGILFSGFWVFVLYIFSFRIIFVFFF